MQPNFLIRTAILSDAAAVCDVLRDTILHSCIQDHQNDSEILAAWLGNKDPDTVGTWLVSPSNHALVAESKGEILGIALLTNKGKIALLYIAPHAQRSGIGTRLLAALEEQAAAWRLATVQIASTVAAQAFLLGQDYRIQCEAVSCFGIKTSLLAKKIAIQSGSAHRAPGKCKCSAEA